MSELCDVTCSRCGATIVWPGLLTTDDKRDIAIAMRESKTSGIQFARVRFGLIWSEPTRGKSDCDAYYPDTRHMPQMQDSSHGRNLSVRKMPIDQSGLVSVRSEQDLELSKVPIADSTT